MSEIVNVNVTKIEEIVTVNAMPNVTQIIVTTSTGGGGAVDSVNGQVGVVLLDTDDIPETATNVYVTPTEKLLIGTAVQPADLPTKTSDLINDGDDGNPFISLLDLPSNIIFYPTNAASDIGGYVKIVTSITDPSYNTTAVDISTGAITTTDQLISSLATSANIIVGNPGVFNITTIGNIRRTAGSGTASFYFEIYKRTSAGVETLIATSDNTIPVIDGGIYVEFSATAIWNDGIFLDTDRVVMKYYANRISGGSNPTYQFQFGGVTPVRTLVPIPLSVVPVLTIDAVPTDGSTNAVSSNGVFDALTLDTSVISCSHAILTLADSTSYFFGTNVGFAPTTSTNISRRFEAPFTGLITDFYVKAISQTVTSAEDVVLKINNKTAGTSHTIGNIRYNNVSLTFIFNGFSIPITKNDSLEFQIVVPILATNGLNSFTNVNSVFQKT
jgi:hypothetical protein